MFLERFISSVPKMPDCGYFRTVAIIRRYSVKNCSQKIRKIHRETAGSVFFFH